MPTRQVALLLLGFLVSAGGCGEPVQQPSDEEWGRASDGTLVSDRESLLRAELEKADREFARNVRDNRLDGWLEAFAEDAMVLPAEGPVARGPNAIRDLFSPLFAESDFEITWAPVGAEVASSGDFGYTFGEWRSSRPAAGEEVETSEGKYVTVWRRDKDGRWRVLLDIGNTRPVAVPGD